MPRHAQDDDDLDFAIHEDQPAAMDESDVRDFADKLSDIESDLKLGKGDETLLDHDVDDHIPVEATDSNMTKASTLVDGQTEEPEEPSKTEGAKDVESTIESMLEELQDKGIADETADSEASLSRRESAVTGTEHGDTEDSFSRRDSACTAETHDPQTERSFSRRESTMSMGTYESSRRESGWENDSYFEPDTEDQHSIVDDEDHTQASYSRRESTYSAATDEPHYRRASGRTEALIQAAARDIVEQINGDRQRESSHSGSTAGDQSVVSNSRTTSARPSDVHESLIDEDAEDTGARPSDSHESLPDANIEHGSARSSDIHESLADEEVEDIGARPSESHESIPDDNIGHASARSSEVHESLADEEVEDTGAQPLDSHESLPDESIEDTSARLSDTRESLVGEIVEDTGAQQSHVHESLADEDVEDTDAQPSNSRESLPYESIENASARLSDAHESLADESIRESIEHEDENLGPTEEAADSSSHNENDDDVFSDDSPRSSVGSFSEAEQRKLCNVTQRRTPRVSDFSHYDTDDQDDIFVPTVRGTPRPPFRSPSSVKAIQMSSPTPSILGSSRSSRRTPLPTVSRLGSPSTQYSPKRTPPRFKRNTPPLVLLHATLLPLRWPWGDVLDHCRPGELSEGGKGLLEAWRQLQDQLGDTVCERGILLPHPQNDFEVLEERLLEALELPLRRRARILECGHYLGPSNEMNPNDETDSDGDFQYEEQRTSRSSFEKKTHWCSTCRSEIRYDSLGVGKVFRVKIYASNGLVKAGAWEACWKEMERVDVEVEPIVEPEVHEELVRLDAEQQKALELSHPDDVEVREEEPVEEEPEESYLEHETTEVHHHIPSSPPPEIRITPSPPSPPVDEDRRRRDEERLREIYGHTPLTHPEPSTDHPPSTEYVDHRTPPSPSAEAFARREERRQTHKNESLPELLLEALKVMMQDRRNVMIGIMSVLVLALALRGGNSPSPGEHNPATWQTVVKEHEAPMTVTVTERAEPAQETMEILASTFEAVMSSAVPLFETSSSEAPTSEASPSEASKEVKTSQAAESCSTGPASADEAYYPAHDEPKTVASQETVVVVQTVTQTAVETATVVETVTATQAQEAQETVVEEDSEPVESLEPVEPTEVAEETVTATEPHEALETVVEEEVPEPVKLTEGHVEDVGDAGEQDVEDEL